MKNIHVVAALIMQNQRLFVTQRGYGDFKGGWEFPGGKIESGETPQEALKREIREELEADIAVEELVGTVEYDYPAFPLTMDCFLCRLRSPHLALVEATDARWIAQDELESLPFLPADRQLLPRLPAYFALP